VTSRELSPLLFLTILLFAGPGQLFSRASAESDGFFTFAAVQFAVSEEIYSSSDSFRNAVNTALDRLEAEAAETAAGRPLDLAIFPEYSSAFLGLSYLSETEIGNLAADPAGNYSLIQQVIRKAEPEILAVWSEISRQRDYAILAGSTLITDSDGRIRNRALLFSPGGELVWTQDKVFPGAPELSLLNLQTGRISDAGSFEIGGFSIVTTICRDTYNPIWEKSLPDADLWIDIKANELPYTREYYSQALPARLPGSPIDFGLTVSLSGEILGFRFTGPTEFMNDAGLIYSTNPYVKNELMLISLPVE
jgi:predicted amidohydrolase